MSVQIPCTWCGVQLQVPGQAPAVVCGACHRVVQVNGAPPQMQNQYGYNAPPYQQNPGQYGGPGAYGVQQQSPYGAQQQSPYGAQQQSPYGAPQSPYGPPQSPYGAQQSLYGASPNGVVAPDVMAPPPRPADRPSGGKGLARAKYDYSGQAADLTFSAGDEIIVHSIVDENWGKGSVKGAKGGPKLFPLTHVEIIYACSTPSGPAAPPRPNQSRPEKQKPQPGQGKGRMGMHGGMSSGNAGGNPATGMAGRAMNNVVNAASTGFGWSFGSTMGKNSAQSIWNKF